MEKKNYEKPAMQLEEFIPNECVAACGDTEFGKYLFVCDAGDGEHKLVYQDNGDGIFDRYSDTKLGGYHACKEEHKTDKEADFLKGFMLDAEWVWDDWLHIIGHYEYDYDNPHKVIIWRGLDGNNIHCTSNLNQESWPVLKS